MGPQMVPARCAYAMALVLPWVITENHAFRVKNVANKSPPGYWPRIEQAEK